MFFKYFTNKAVFVCDTFFIVESGDIADSSTDHTTMSGDARSLSDLQVP